MRKTLKSRERNRLLPGAGLFVLLVSAAATAQAGALQPLAVPPEAPSAAAEEARRRGIAYLLKSQNEDGSWGRFESARPWEVYLGSVASHRAFRAATSALCVLALLGPAQRDTEVQQALERGLHYLLEEPPLYRATGEVLYNVWGHGYVLQAMSAVLGAGRLSAFHSRARKVAQREIKLLRELQGADGGWSYYDFQFARQHPTGRISTSFTTAAVLVALHEARLAGLEVAAPCTDAALRSLSRLRRPDGAYIYGLYLRLRPEHLANHVQGSLGRSQSCNLALWLHQHGVGEEELERGLENLSRFHHFIEMGKSRPYPHESWYATAGYYFFFGHYYAARIARELPAEKGRRFLAELRETIIRLQDEDGSWWDFPFYGYHKPYGTAFALLTLDLARETK